MSNAPSAVRVSTVLFDYHHGRINHVQHCWGIVIMLVIAIIMVLVLIAIPYLELNIKYCGGNYVVDKKRDIHTGFWNEQSSASGSIVCLRNFDILDIVYSVRL